jgi:NTE family protein
MNKLTIIITVLLALPWSVSSQQATDDVTVGLVLSGGGAKGLAHIGVIEVLEDYGIRIDRVAGTSMGAIVGGFYALGFDASQMDSLVQQHDLGDIIMGELPRASTGIRSRKYDEKTFLTLTYSRGRLDIPAGISDGQRIYDFLYQNTYPLNQELVFDSLSRPFFCVAADLATGQQVVLDSGNIATAMRASSALPTIVNPVRLGSQILVDGGVANNLPAQEMREKGVDVVLCVSVEDGLSTADELQSATDIFSQVSSFSIVQKSQEQYEYCDVLIRPDISAYGLLDFDARQDLVRLGKAAALTHQDDLVKIGRRQQALEPYEAVQAPRYERYLRLQGVEIDADEATTRYLQARLPWQVGTYIDMEDISTGINQIEASGFFDEVYYELIPSDEVSVTLRLAPQLKRNFDNTFGVGIHFDNLYGVGLLLQSKQRSLFTYRDELQLDLTLGNRLRYDLQYYINRSAKTDFGLRSSFEYNEITTTLAEPLRVDSSLSITQIPFVFRDFYNEVTMAPYDDGNTLIELAAGIHHYSVESDQVENQAMNGLSIEDTWYLTTDARYYFDNLDSRQHSMRGRRLELSAKGLYPVYIDQGTTVRELGLNLDMQLLQFFPLADKLSAGVEVNMGVNLLQTHLPMLYNYGSANQNLLNRFRPFPGLDLGEATGGTALYASPFLRWLPIENCYITGHFRSLYVTDQRSAFFDSDAVIFGGGVSMGINTVIGPVEVVYGFVDDVGEIYFNLGYWF